MRFKLAFVAALALLASPGWAAPAGSGFYAGAGVGTSDLAVSGFRGDDFAYKLFVGYDFMQYVGVEGAYWDFGNPSDHGIDVGLSGWDVAVRGTLPVADDFELFAKLGYTWWDGSIHGYGHGSGDDMMYGVGVGYRFGGHLGLRGEWERMDVQDTSRADLWTVSGYWKF